MPDVHVHSHSAPPVPPTGFGTRVVVGLLRAYQAAISPLFPPTCRFQPSCSHYAVEAVTRFGPGRGSWRALRRLLRCHPFHPGGYDPVDPEA